MDCTNRLDYWTGLMGWANRLDYWTGLMDWINRLDYWTGLMDQTIGQKSVVNGKEDHF